MFHIVAGILSLIQYQATQKNNLEPYRLERCCSCGRFGVWRHGYYPRKADRFDPSQNPILIQRFLCPECHKTSSVLPECIPPRRWYLWDVQQIALLLLIQGQSFNAVAKQINPARSTLRRWLLRLEERYQLHRDALCQHIEKLGRTVNFKDFWQTFLNDYLLSTAMRLFHVAGIFIP